ncbi:hypothetical protein ACET3Z_031033 [Daucus carota]
MACSKFLRLLLRDQKIFGHFELEFKLGVGKSGTALATTERLKKPWDDPKQRGRRRKKRWNHMKKGGIRVFFCYKKAGAETICREYNFDFVKDVRQSKMSYIRPVVASYRNKHDVLRVSDQLNVVSIEKPSKSLVVPETEPEESTKKSSSQGAIPDASSITAFMDQVADLIDSKVIPSSNEVPHGWNLLSLPSPGAPPFIQVGDKVQKGQVICTIEAMKLMNAIEASHD